MLAGTVLLGVGLSGVFAIDGPTGEPVAAELQETDENQEEREEPQEEKDGGKTEELQDNSPDETRAEDSGRAQQSADVRSEQHSYGNAISGVIWLDENEDGLMDEDEPVISDFPVRLYQDDQLIDEVKTDADGSYQFEDLEPGEYVLEVRSEIIGKVEYLLPLCGIQGDNRFTMTETAEEDITALSDPVQVEADTRIQDISAGMRLPAGIVATAGETYEVTIDTGGKLGEYNDLEAAVAACQDGTPRTITVTKNDTLSAYVNIPAAKQITLTSGSGGAFTITQTATVAATDTSSNAGYIARHFRVAGSLTLDNIVLSGMGYTTVSDRYNGGVYVTTDASVKMTNRATIQQCFYREGGGVYMYSGSAFEMTSGEISGNIAVNGGGVFMWESSFTMRTGEISGNTADQDGGGVYVQSNSSFTMKGGKIICNTADYGGGVEMWDSSTFTMKGGKIICNTAVYGGGVDVWDNSSTLKMKDGEINKNTADYGGGVYLYNSTLEMKGGEINKNTADYGGGVYVYRGANFKMESGEINYNSAYYGGGVI